MLLDNEFLLFCRVRENEKSRFLERQNRFIWYTLSPMALSLGYAKFANSYKAIPWFYAQAAMGTALLEVVNYVEHYGLSRSKLQDGSYEPVNPMHSWNAPHTFSNAALFKLERHSDHHTYPMRPYQLLRNFKESPQLPTGYLGMISLAMFPPAFYWVMNPLVKAIDDFKTSKPGDVR